MCLYVNFYIDKYKALDKMLFINMHIEIYIRKYEMLKHNKQNFYPKMVPINHICFGWKHLKRFLE